MTAKVAAVTTVASKVRDTLRVNLNEGWNATTIAAKMQMLGHTGWNATVVNSVVNKGRLLTVDEAIGLVAVFKAKAVMLTEDVDALTKLIHDGATAKARTQ